MQPELFYYQNLNFQLPETPNFEALSLRNETSNHYSDKEETMTILMTQNVDYELTERGPQEEEYSTKDYSQEATYTLQN